MLGAFSDEIRDGDGLEAQEIGGEGVHAVRHARGVNDIGGDHGVEVDVVDLQAEIAERVDVVFEILPGLFNGGIGEQRAEEFAD